MQADLQRLSDRIFWFRTPAILLLLLSATLILTGCGKSGEATKPPRPVAIEAGDECYVCGMIIVNYPGPKGEAYVRGRETPLKFCSTRDLFSYLLQPESKVIVTQVYVHDMAATDWNHPANSAFVDARSAWYVADQPLKGAMGPTLASFKTQKGAEAFHVKHGGRLLRFEDITLEILANLDGDASKHMHP